MAQPIIVAREQGLRQDLGRGQIIMISLGGAIGTTLFLSSGVALGYAGPSVLLSYAIAGFIALAMVLSLSEMAAAHPAAGSFGVYAETYLGPWAGFVTRYTYWFAQVIATGFEAVAAGIYMTWWFPQAPVWIWSLGFASAVIWVNARSVSQFGTVEYVFSTIKVAAIVIFIILGGAEIFGLSGPAVGLGNLYKLPGGVFPHGPHGMWMAVILGVLSFVGIEVIAVTSGETADPARTIPAALRTTALRIFLFYVLALAVVAALIPWNQVGAGVVVTESPFVRVLARSGVPAAAGIMNLVIVTAALSGMNTNVYLCSRMLFSLSRGGHAPGFLGRLGASGTPVAATLLSGAGVLMAAAVARVTPKAYSLLQGVALFGAITVWILILVSHLAFRRAHDRAGPDRAALPVRAPGFPGMQIAGLALLAGVLATLGLDKDWRLSWQVGVPWLALLTIAYFIARPRPASAPALTQET